MNKTEKDYWDQAKELLGNHQVTYEANRKFDFLNNPEGLLFYLSKCKFAMRMATKNRNVLEIGSEIGVGASILGEMAKSYVGVETDERAVEIARKNLPDMKYTFYLGSYSEKRYGTFDTVIALDIAETMDPVELDRFLGVTLDQLSEKGIFVLGISAEGDLALKVGEKLRQLYHQAWRFGMSGEIIHTHTQAPYYIYLSFQIR